MALKLASIAPKKQAEISPLDRAAGSNPNVKPKSVESTAKESARCDGRGPRGQSAWTKSDAPLPAQSAEQPKEYAGPIAGARGVHRSSRRI